MHEFDHAVYCRVISHRDVEAETLRAKAGRSWIKGSPNRSIFQRLSQIPCMQSVSIRPSSAQLLGLCFFGALEIIVGVHEEKPSTLPVIDRTCLL